MAETEKLLQLTRTGTDTEAEFGGNQLRRLTETEKKQTLWQRLAEPGAVVQRWMEAEVEERLQMMLNAEGLKAGVMQSMTATRVQLLTETEAGNLQLLLIVVEA